MSKNDTNFGKTILKLAREAYGKNFMFDKCTITAHGEEQFVVTFDIDEGEKVPPNTTNFDKLSNLQKYVDGDSCQ